MQSDHAKPIRVSPTNRSAVSNGTKLLDGIDGRSPTARRFRDLVQAFQAEFGGALSEADKLLVRQAAALTIRAEQLQADLVNGLPVDADALIRLTGTANRILGSINAKSRKRKPAGGDALRTYLAERATEAA